MTQKETFDFLKDYIDKKIDGSYDTIRDILTENKTKEVGENIGKEMKDIEGGERKESKKKVVEKGESKKKVKNSEKK